MYHRTSMLERLGSLWNHMRSTYLLMNLTSKQNLSVLQKYETGAWKQLQKWLLKTTFSARSVWCGSLIQWEPLILSWNAVTTNALTRWGLANFPEPSLLPLASWEAECSAQTWKWLILSLHVKLPVYVLTIYSPLQPVLSANHLVHACYLQAIYHRQTRGGLSFTSGYIPPWTDFFHRLWIHL